MEEPLTLAAYLLDLRELRGLVGSGDRSVAQACAKQAARGLWRTLAYPLGGPDAIAPGGTALVMGDRLDPRRGAIYFHALHLLAKRVGKRVMLAPWDSFTTSAVESIDTSLRTRNGDLAIAGVLDRGAPVPVPAAGGERTIGHASAAEANAISMRLAQAHELLADDAAPTMACELRRRKSKATSVWRVCIVGTDVVEESGTPTRVQPRMVRGFTRLDTAERTYRSLIAERLAEGYHVHDQRERKHAKRASSAAVDGKALARIEALRMLHALAAKRRRDVIVFTY